MLHDGDFKLFYCLCEQVATDVPRLVLNIIWWRTSNNTVTAAVSVSTTIAVVTVNFVYVTLKNRIQVQQSALTTEDPLDCPK